MADCLTSLPTFKRRIFASGLHAVLVALTMVLTIGSSVRAQTSGSGRTEKILHWLATMGARVPILTAA
jgi:hypothetical protein